MTDPDYGERLERGTSALASGKAGEAIALLEPLRDGDGLDANGWRTLGLSYRRQQRLDDARDALRKALDLDPQMHAARLQLGMVHEQLRQPHEALVAFFSAISSAQAQGRWLNPSNTPPQLLPMVRHALDAVSRGRRELFDRSLEPLRERYGRDSLARVEHCLAMYLGHLPTAYTNPRQKPTFLFFPGLPDKAWYEPELFPWYDVLQDNWTAIRDECLDVMGDGDALEPFMVNPVNIQGLPYIGGPSANPHWDAYFFHRHGERYESHCQRCPTTAAALDAVPLVRIRDHAPECLYSVLTPGSNILPHRGVTNTRLVTHLPLIVPGNGALRVAGEAREWTAGRCFSFDDTFLHEAWNHSDRIRVVVLLDCWNPYMTEVEQLAIAELVAAIGDFGREAKVPLPGDE